jgi:hypothetical protein
MFKKLAFATAAVLAMSAPAFAHHCPKDAAAIDAYLSRTEVDANLKAQVIALKDKGMEAHKAGDHATSEAELAEAMRMLLNGK